MIVARCFVVEFVREKSRASTLTKAIAGYACERRINEAEEVIVREIFLARVLALRRR